MAVTMIKVLVLTLVVQYTYSHIVHNGLEEKSLTINEGI